MSAYDISAWMPSNFFSAHEGITFFDHTEPNARTNSPVVQNAQPGKLCWTSLQDCTYPLVRFNGYRTYNVLSCFMHLYSMNGDSFFFFIDIDENELAKYLAPAKNLEIADTTPIKQFVIDSNGTIISHEDKELLYQTLAPEIMGAVQENSIQPIDKTVYIGYPLHTTGWQLILSVPENYLYNSSYINIVGLLTAIGVTIAVSFCLSLFISQRLTKKLKRMSTALSTIQPSFNPMENTQDIIRLRLPVTANPAARDELDELAVAFNYLADHLNQNIQTIINDSLTQERLRYRLLRAKINPHFLYNILDSIKICNTLGRFEDANRMLVQLADFYRLILRKNDLDIITIREEIEIVQLYLEMEAISHEQDFSWELEIDPDIDQFAIPRFVLQPLVENCVTHGLPGSRQHMTIRISIRYTDESIMIKICDNGMGMDEDRLNHLYDVLHANDASAAYQTSTDFYGLTNIVGRLRPYVADPNDPIRYESKPNAGTTVTIELQQLLPDT